MLRVTQTVWNDICDNLEGGHLSYKWREWHADKNCVLPFDPTYQNLWWVENMGISHKNGENMWEIHIFGGNTSLSRFKLE